MMSEKQQNQNESDIPEIKITESDILSDSKLQGALFLFNLMQSQIDWDNKTQYPSIDYSTQCQLLEYYKAKEIMEKQQEQKIIQKQNEDNKSDSYENSSLPSKKRKLENDIISIYQKEIDPKSEKSIKAFIQRTRNFKQGIIQNRLNNHFNKQEDIDSKYHSHQNNKKIVYQFDKAKSQYQQQKQYSSINKDSDLESSLESESYDSNDKNQGDRETKEDTKNLLRNFGSAQSRYILQNNYSQQFIEEWFQFDDIKINNFKKWASSQKLENFEQFKQLWHVEDGEEQEDFKELYRELSFEFYQKHASVYVLGSQMRSEKTRRTHIKYIYRFLEGIIDPSCFYYFKKQDKRDKMFISFEDMGMSQIPIEPANENQIQSDQQQKIQDDNQ